jgi:hypothetical protein
LAVVKRPLLYETWLPEWAREEMLSHLPGQPTAEYWSKGLIGDDEVRLDLLAVLRSQLLGVRMEAVREPVGLPSHAEYMIDVHGLGASAIQSVGSQHAYFMFPDDQRESRRNAVITVTLKRGLSLGPWESPISLPLARDDYQRDWKQACEAALDFGKALIAELR